MAYTICLARKSGAPITLEEWRGAVSKHALVRLSQDAEITVANSGSGERMSRATSMGDADIWLEDSQTWVYAFRWGEDGRARIHAPRDFDDPHSFLRNLLRELAQGLGAGVYGEADEEYR